MWAFVSVCSMRDMRAVGEIYVGRYKEFFGINYKMFHFMAWIDIKEGDNSYCDEIPLNSSSEKWENECAVVEAESPMKNLMKWLDECFPVIKLLLNYGFSSIALHFLTNTLFFYITA